VSIEAVWQRTIAILERILAISEGNRSCDAMNRRPTVQTLDASSVFPKAMEP
jgi:hypothetical protein